MKKAIFIIRRTKNSRQQKYCCNWGWTEEQSTAVHIQALYPADGILPVISSRLRLLVINLASVPGGQLVNSSTAAILDRCLQAYDRQYPDIKTTNYYDQVEI